MYRPGQRKRDGIWRSSGFRGNLCDAVNALEADPFLLEVIGRETARQYIDSKRKEWNSYRSQVTQWEIREYLNRY